MNKIKSNSIIWCASLLCLWWNSVTSVEGNFCPETTRREYWVDCTPCSRYQCPDGEIKLMNSTTNCTYELDLINFGFALELPGCTYICASVDTIYQCCTGYWGTDCTACPGGAEEPCSGNGVCSDRINGTGECTCQAGVKGYACELCVDDDTYGEDCAQKCQCQYGNCTGNGVNGDGSCTCFSGYEGQFCHQEIVSCETLQCQDHANCVEERGVSFCQCESGYTANGSKCQESNTCDNPDQNCDENASCQHVAVHQYTCTCLEGYHGDGVYCDPVDPCQVDFGGCDVESSVCKYLAPNMSKCVCLEGFTVDPEYGGCMIEDLCPSQASKCDKNANCSTNDPGIITCTCTDGYVGDGFACYGNIIQRLHDINENDRRLKSQLFSAIRLAEFAYKDVLSTGGPFTIFAPMDSAINAARGRQFQDIFFEVDIARQLLRQHLIARPLKIEELTNQTELFTLEGIAAQMYYQGNILTFRLRTDSTRAIVLKSDVVAANGIIHVVDQVFKKRYTHAPLQNTLMNYIQTVYSMSHIKKLVNKMKAQGFSIEGMGLLGDMAHKWTVFVPKSTVFRNLLAGTIDHLLDPKQKNKLTQIMNNHVVKGQLDIANLVNTKKFVTMANNGIKVTVTDGGQIQLGSNVTIVNSQLVTGNGIIHMIDSILIPDSIETLLPRFCSDERTLEVRGPCGVCQATRCARSDIPTNKRDVEGCVLDSPHYLWPPHHRGRHRWNPFEDDRFEFMFDDYMFLPPRKQYGCQKICHRLLSEPQVCKNRENQARQEGGCISARITVPEAWRSSNKSNKKCCDNFYGTECYPCLGGHENPCFGRGKCLDGMSRNGSCVCDAIYTGTGCEFCTDNKKYGPACNQTCPCLHGVCNNAASMSGGMCKSCNPGFYGQYCAQTIERCTRHLRCHINAVCIKKFQQRGGRRRNRSYCQCKQGYTGYGTHCVEVDPCDTGALECHTDASCVKTGPGVAECRCNAGWVGDGLYCFPSTACETEEHCDVNATCVNVSPGQSQCECNENYHGNGTICIPVDVCEDNYIQCDDNATCNSTGPGLGTCTCQAGLVGDGFTCFGDIAFQLQKVSDLQEVNKLTKLVPSGDLYLSDLRANLTLFAPNSTAVVELMEQEDSAWTSVERNLLLLLRYHTLPVTLDLEDLKGMSGERLIPLVEDFYLNVTVRPEGEIYINDAKIIKGDLFALNGFIHVVDKILEPYPPPELLPSLGEALQETPQFSLFYYLLKRNHWMRKDGLVSDEISREMYEYTVFAPVNSAWEGHEFVNVTSSRYLKAYFVINKPLTKSDLLALDGQTLSTYLGTGNSLTVTVKDSNTVLVNGAEVILWDLKTYTGYIHGIRTLINPVLNFCPGIDQTNKCCPGYYGDNCEECPGGGANPCSGHGQCQSDGSCHCDEPYSGEACDLCDPESCLQSVDHCSVNNGGCHPFAVCRLNDKLVTCSCVGGYIGDGYRCVSPCQIERGGCHRNATCELEFKRPTCRCRSGFTGNGVACAPVLGPCDFRNGGCSAHARCDHSAGENTINCTCAEGYTGDGLTCLTNVWQTLKDIVQEDGALKPFLQMLRKPENLKVKKRLEKESRNVTLFAPEFGKFSEMSGGSFVSDSLLLLDNSLTLDTEVMCADGSTLYVTVDYNASETDGNWELYKLCTYTTRDHDGVSDVRFLSENQWPLTPEACGIQSPRFLHAELEFRVNGVRVILKNLLATNGVIHLLDSVYTVHRETAKQLPDANTTQTFTKIHRLSLWGGLGVLAVLGLVILISVLSWRKRHSIQYTFNRLRSGNGFTFQHLEEEGENGGPAVSFHSASGGSAEDTLEELPCSQK